MDNPGIRKSIYFKNKLFHVYFKNKSELVKSRYKLDRNNLKHLINITKKQY